MKVLIAVDSFKDSSSIDGSMAISTGIQEVFPNAHIVTLPLADGGEGTVEALVHATNGRVIETPVTGPLNEKINACYGILGDGKTAVIEVAAACGLPLVPEERRNPKVTTTYGVGELIRDAIKKGYREFIIGLGGSSTIDAGVGMLQALGFQFLNKHGQEVGLGGKVLKEIEEIDDSGILAELSECNFRIACDVNNPLYGPLGAAYIFGPQKGATDAIIKELDEGLSHFSKVVTNSLHINLHSIPGAGAAGGLGAAFIGFLQGELQSGIELILDFIRINEKLEGVDLVITGEGKLDGQTSMGKAPLGVAKLAKQKGIPVIGLAGAISKETSTLHDLGFTSYFSIVNEPMSLEKAMNRENTIENLRILASQVFRLVKAVRN